MPRPLQIRQKKALASRNKLPYGCGSLLSGYYFPFCFRRDFGNGKTAAGKINFQAAKKWLTLRTFCFRTGIRFGNQDSKAKRGR
jgi:hypothetical protein